MQEKSNCVGFNEVIWLIIMEIKMLMKNGLHPYDIKKPWRRHRRKCTKYKKCHGKMISICSKQHLSNI